MCEERLNPIERKDMNTQKRDDEIQDTHETR